MTINYENGRLRLIYRDEAEAEAAFERLRKFSPVMVCAGGYYNAVEIAGPVTELRESSAWVELPECQP